MAHLHHPPAATPIAAAEIPIFAPAYIDRVRRIIAKLRNDLIADPDDRYAALCLPGWEAELVKIEQEQRHASQAS